MAASQTFLASKKAPVSVLFVCLGNICRSPMAQGVLQHLVKERQLENLIERIDSCGTANYHEGAEADDRTLSTLGENGMSLCHAARPLIGDDFTHFSLILALDRENLRIIKSKAPNDCKATICLFGEFGPPGVDKVVSDPYYGSSNGFKTTYDQCLLFSEGLISALHDKEN